MNPPQIQALSRGRLLPVAYTARKRPERAPTHRSTAEIGAPDRIHRDAKLKVSNLSARKPFVIPNFWNSAHLFPVDTQTLSAGIALTALCHYSLRSFDNSIRQIIGKHRALFVTSLLNSDWSAVH
ncbi:hypothetical protein CDAR_217941 [Caerostris darwini]|uniref:Uncharacterized protein n=1 Tax=Caerostris darwini TaxID=1538125 RepID=A0AAV4VP52_9ARAC|nr:hypothetical protein CDAR_217941 [Caerostris darwini]